MRIAQVSPLYFPVPPADHGGTERVVHILSEALLQRGHDVVVFAADGSSTRAPLRPQGPAVASIKGAPPSLLSAMELVMLDRVAETADEFDVIHCHTELAHAAVLRAVRHKVVMTIHWRADEADRRTYFAHFTDQKVVAISRAQAADLPPGNVAGVVHHGIPATRLALGPGGGGYVAFVGRMTDQKRPDVAARVGRAAGLRVKLAGTVDVGNPSYFDTVVRPELVGGVEYVGPVGDADKQALLGEAEAFLFPVDWPEPFGLVMIEAMACGTPVVAFRRGSVPEVVDDGVTGFVVDTAEAAVAALAAARRLDRSAVRARFEARFTAARMAAEYEAVYRAVAAGTA
ncbi:glycosyltransferase family 4 protein [Acuticoccus sp.]|uniref:glycosyltransferase family 4 protein n=1 Tax=Acuticoccus sp. TaxID=1904378 RepID=UPI003B529B5A